MPTVFADNGDSELPLDLSEENLQADVEAIRAFYEPKQPVEPPALGSEFGRVVVLGSKRLQGLPVTLSSLDEEGPDYVAVVCADSSDQQRQYTAVFPRVPEGGYFCSCFVCFTQVSVWNGELVTVDFSMERERRHHARKALS